MKEVVLIVRPEKLEIVKNVLNDLNCEGMTISTVMGAGAQKGFTEEEAVTNQIKGLQTSINLLPKIKVETVVPDEKVEPIILEIRDKIATGNVGDGKIFVREIVDAVRVRTGERGNAAL